MSYLDKSLKEIHEALKSGEVTSKELVEESLKRARDNQEELNGFVVDLYLGRIGVLLIYIVVSVGGRLVVGCKYCFT